MKSFFPTCFLFLLFCLPCSTGQNQKTVSDDSDRRTENNPEAIAEQAIQILKEGVLIVRLETNSRKIDELEKLMASEEVDEAKKERLATLVEATKAETHKKNKIFVDAFQAHYDFSKVLFMYDTSAVHLTAGKTEGIFLNNSLAPDPSIKLNDDKYLIAYFGKNPLNHTKSDVEGMVILDGSMNVIPPPFPYFIYRLKTAYFFAVDFEEKYYTAVVQNLNKKLKKFAQKK